LSVTTATQTLPFHPTHFEKVKIVNVWKEKILEFVKIKYFTGISSRRFFAEKETILEDELCLCES
jgi:hypothetical protein